MIIIIIIIIITQKKDKASARKRAPCLEALRPIFQITTAPFVAEVAMRCLNSALKEIACFEKKKGAGYMKHARVSVACVIEWACLHARVGVQHVRVFACL